MTNKILLNFSRLFSFMSIVFLLFAPFLIYCLESFMPVGLLKYYIEMPIPMRNYFLIVAPAVIICNFFLKRIISKNRTRFSQKEISWKKILLFSIVGCFFPGHIGWLSGKLLFISGYYLISSKYRRLLFLYLLLYLCFGFLFNGILGEYVIWIILVILSDINFNLKLSRLKTFYILLGLCFLIFAFQVVKVNYRQLYWNDQGVQVKYPKLLELPLLFSEPEIGFPLITYISVVRLNHGQFIAKTIENNNMAMRSEVPNFVSSIFVSFIPRFFWENKPKAGGVENVEKYLGDSELGYSGYSYNVGPLGESIGDFGYFGIFLYPFFISVIYLIAIYFSTRFIAELSPFFFYNIVMVEHDFLGAFNSLTTSFVYLMGIFYLLKIFYVRDIR